MSTSTRNDYTGFDRSLRRLNRSLSVFSEDNLIEALTKLKDENPREFIFAYLSLSKFVLDNKEFLKTPTMKQNEGVLEINFIDEGSELQKEKEQLKKDKAEFRKEKAEFKKEQEQAKNKK